MNTHQETRRRRDARKHARGFTLIEVMVTMAIFITVMGGVTLLFNSAIRTSKQTFQNQDAFEVARGALKILERDINRAFTSRDTGDAHNFYGTPIGMTFIGLITDSGGNDNVARITYVIHRNAGGQTLTAIPADDDDIITDRVTYSLVRYVETGAEDLDTFPVDWFNVDGGWVVDDDDFSGASTLEQVVDDAVSNATCDDGPPVCICTSEDLACQDEVEKGMRRELWIRMLSGDSEVPDFWALADLDNFEGPDGLDAEDYIVAENILHVERNGTLGVGDPLIQANHTAYFEVPYLGSQFISQVGTPDFAFFTYREFGVQGTFFPGSDSLIERSESTVVPIELAYWNDRRNADYAQQYEEYVAFGLVDGEDNDGDGRFDYDDPNEAETDGISLGSPLDARAPVDITVSFTLFFESPYPGAPDFQRTFSQQIDVPSGYRRAYTTPVWSQ